MKTEIVEVDPTLAQEWLLKNDTNRRMRQRIIDAYARDMTNGKWVLNGDGVKFGTDGNLMDGQHRLMAIIAAKVTLPMLVVRDISPEAILTIDTGVKRKFQDHLAIQGTANPALTAATARRVTMWLAGVRMHATFAPTFADMEATLLEHPDILTSADLATHWYGPSSLIPSVASTTHWLFSQTNSKLAAEFHDRVFDGDQLEFTDPRAALRRRVVEDKVNRRSVPWVEQTALVILAWNSWLTEIRLSRMQLPKGGLTQENYPIPL